MSSCSRPGPDLVVSRNDRSIPLTCDVSGVRHPDAVTLDALARLQLMARRHGCTMVLHGACEELQELIRLVGLVDELPTAVEVELCVEPLGQSEQREEVGGIEEEGDAGDPLA